MVLVGTDLIEIDRISKTIENYGQRFLNRIYTEHEINFCRGKVNSLAGRFAAKEAFIKSIGIGIRKGINFKDIYVINDKFGKPNIKFSNKVNNLIVKKLKTRNFDIFLSLSDEKNYSIAFVVIQKK